jgi:hypothetical protein
MNQSKPEWKWLDRIKFNSALPSLNEIVLFGYCYLQVDGHVEAN